MANIDILSLSDIIGTKLLVKTTDHRELTGTLLALDNKPNLLLNDVSEKSIQHGNIIDRAVGLISVPFDTISQVNIDNSDLDKTIDWKSKLI